MKEMIPNIYR